MKNVLSAMVNVMGLAVMGCLFAPPTPVFAQEEASAERQVLVDLNGNGVADVGEPAVTVSAAPTCQSCPRAPRLRQPRRDAVITQNNEGIGCAADPARGFGFEIVFDWADARDKDGILNYDLVVKKDTAANPLLDITVAISNRTYTACNVFVPDDSLDGWTWQVRARDTLGNLSDWSTRSFSFEPCLLADGSACHVP